MVEQPESSVEKLISKYVTNGSISDAVAVAERMNYETMRSRYPDGVPPRLMFTASVMALDWISQYLMSMIIGVKAENEGWTEQQAETQESFGRRMVSLLRADAQQYVLEADLKLKELRAEEGDDDEAGIV